MSNFLQSVRDMEDKVEAAKLAKEAQDKARQDQRKAEEQAYQLAMAETVSKIMGLDGTFNFSDPCKINLGDWELRFEIGYSKTQDGYKFQCIKLTHDKLNEDGNVCWNHSKKEAVFNRIYWEIDFVYIKASYKNFSEETKDLIGNLNRFEKHPVLRFNNSFKMGFEAISEIGSKDYQISEADRLNMAKNILEIERKYQDALQDVPQWEQAAQAYLDERKREQEERVKEQERQRIEREKREQEWAERIAKEEQERESQSRYTFSGETLGEILEQVVRALAEQERES